MVEEQDMLSQAVRYLEVNHQELVNEIAMSLDKSAWHPDRPCMATFGLYNAGKSSLLNMLVEDENNTIFPTGGVPTTGEPQHHVYQGVELIDTPGLDHDQCDDATAFEELLRCDLILLVHSLGQGEMDAVITEYLEQLQSKSDTPIAQRIVAVWTHAGMAPDAALLATLHQQLHEATGGNPPQFSVDSTMCWKAMQRHDEELMQLSGIPALRRYLSEQLPTGKRLHLRREARRRHHLKRAIMALNDVVKAQDEHAGRLRQALRRDASSALYSLAENHRRVKQLSA